MSHARVGVVTGANKGIGYAIVRQLALQYPKSHLNNGSLLIYLTARDKSRGEQALSSIQGDADLKQAKALSQHGGPADIKYHQLDISDSNSIADLASFLKKEHPDGIDFVINNAGIAMQGFDSNVVKNTIAVNYYGTLEATRAWIPLLKPDGRVVNVASISGSLSKYSSEIKERFQSSQSVSDVTKLMEDFTSAVDKGTHEKEGWPSAAYAVSKAGEIGMTRAIAKELLDKGSKVLVNSCHPGYVVTDMTRGGGTKTPDQGAQTPVHLALADIGKTGEYWSDEKVAKW
ncbi:Carbonyl reductase [NADPH] 1 [Colletotrichum orbiculare MAFF 240422]|uniref:Carbonyl reductase [NADPH] 1 n=1 Tax=Colletotrichum orbiculare (strain 104-T / ATCC 96160 / CBS 514.97 / LARS 414 / MAFF 240422) TaxID=1213857 RepID=N4VJ62_COLOR|nr:Carbonyl reductase [NADPH] 1 [Colletotrichum orbiculare MAFF 240422]